MAQRKTGKTTGSDSARGGSRSLTTRGGSGSGSRSAAGTTRSGSGNGSRSSGGTVRGGSNASRGGRNGGKRGGNSSGTILLKAVLFVLGIALVFGITSWGLEKLDERSKNKTPTTAPTGTAEPGGNNTGKNQTDPNNPTDTPTPVPTQSLEDHASAVLRGFSRSKLKLDKDLSEYRLEIDDYTSNFPGRDKEYVGVNVLQKDKDALVAIFYVAVDGSEILREREDGEFDTITP